jgi:hypothetical protein
MTDEKTEAPAKPAWTRCKACRQRLWNDRIDIEVHRSICPADLLRTIKALTKRVERLEERPVPHVVEPATGPAIDFEQEAPWPDAGPEEEDDLPEVPDIAASGPVPTVRPSSIFDDEDDEDDLDPASIRASIR